jgi:hypothetical protein
MDTVTITMALVFQLVSGAGLTGGPVTGGLVIGARAIGGRATGARQLSLTHLRPNRGFGLKVIRLRQHRLRLLLQIAIGTQRSGGTGVPALRATTLT